MKNNMEKEQWIDDIINSMEGSQRAKPPQALFDKIETSIYRPEAKMIPMSMQRIVAVAASLLMLLNLFALKQYQKVENRQQSFIETGTSTNSNEGLFSDYNIYE